MIYHITFVKVCLKSKMVSLHIIPKFVLNPKKKKKLHDLDSVFNYIKDFLYIMKSSACSILSLLFQVSILIFSNLLIHEKT